MFFVKYENLSNNPQETLNSIYDYIGEESFQHDFKNIKKEVFEDDSHFGAYGNHSVQKELKPSKEGSWKEVFSEDIGNKIKHSNNWYFQAFGYE